MWKDRPDMSHFFEHYADWDGTIENKHDYYDVLQSYDSARLKLKKLKERDIGGVEEFTGIVEKLRDALRAYNGEAKT